MAGVQRGPELSLEGETCTSLTSAGPNLIRGREGQATADQRGWGGVPGKYSQLRVPVLLPHGAAAGPSRGRRAAPGAAPWSPPTGRPQSRDNPLVLRGSLVTGGSYLPLEAGGRRESALLFLLLLGVPEGWGDERN